MQIGTPTGFDAAAHRYDADERGNRVLAYMRARAFSHFGQAFARESKLIELGSGTGTEAARLASEMDCRIALVDVSPRLLEQAARKVAATRAESLIGRHLLPARMVGDLAQVYGHGSFDGAYSSFGALNCEPSLAPVAAGLARLVRSGGMVVLSIINRWCPAEVLWYALHAQWREAGRRWFGPVEAAAYPGGPKDVSTWYYSRREITAAFSPHFVTECVEALPLFWPPPYLSFLTDRFDAFFSRLRQTDTLLASVPGLRDLGDHVLLRLRRR